MSDLRDEMVKVTVVGARDGRRCYQEQWATPTVISDPPMLDYLLSRLHGKLNDFAGGPTDVEMVLLGNRRWTVRDGQVVDVEVVDLTLG